MWHWLYYEVVIDPWVEWDHVSGNMHALLKRFWNLSLQNAPLMESEPKKINIKMRQKHDNDQFIITCMFWGGEDIVFGVEASPTPPPPSR